MGEGIMNKRSRQRVTPDEARRLTIYTTQELYDSIRDEAYQRDVSMSLIVREALDDYLGRHADSHRDLGA